MKRSLFALAAYALAVSFNCQAYLFQLSWYKLIAMQWMQMVKTIMYKNIEFKS